MTKATPWAGAAAALCVAAAHVPITGEHLREAPYIGALFVCLELTCVALAASLVRRGDYVAWSAAGTVMAALVAYVLSRTIGLPQIRDDVGNWTEPWGIAAVAVESLLLVLSLAVLLGSRREGEPVGKDASGRFARV